METGSKPAGIELRPVAQEHREFLCRLYASTRQEELAAVPWSAEEKEAFLRQQFTAQDRQYRAYPGMDYRVVLEDGRPVGRLYLSRTAGEIRIVDIALLPERRGAGIGTWLLRQVLAEGERAAKPVGIHVEIYNPARRLYERLGFSLQQDRGVYLYMVRAPGGTVSGDVVAAASGAVATAPAPQDQAKTAW